MNNNMNDRELLALILGVLAQAVRSGNGLDADDCEELAKDIRKQFRG